jgi:hypothetical protein
MASIYPSVTSLPTSYVVLYDGSQGSTWFMKIINDYIDTCNIGNELIDRILDKQKRYESSDYHIFFFILNLFQEFRRC